MRSSLAAVLCSTLCLSACGNATPDPMPTEPILSTITASALPSFADGADFCAKLGKPACEPNDTIIMLLSGHQEPLTLRGGQVIQLATFASRDATTQQAHLLLNYNGASWALPALNAYDPSSGVRATTVTMRFGQDEAETMGDDMFVVHLATSLELSPGGKMDFHEFHYYCKAGQQISCARVNASSMLMDSMDTANLESGATVLPVLKEGGARVEIMDLGAFQYGDKHDMTRRAELLAQGDHALVFP
jgi:hypothetical protein